MMRIGAQSGAAICPSTSRSPAPRDDALTRKHPYRVDLGEGLAPGKAQVHDVQRGLVRGIGKELTPCGMHAGAVLLARDEDRHREDVVQRSARLGDKRAQML